MIYRIIYDDFMSVRLPGHGWSRTGTGHGHGSGEQNV